MCDLPPVGVNGPTADDLLRLGHTFQDHTGLGLVQQVKRHKLMLSDTPLVDAGGSLGSISSGTTLGHSKE